MANRTTEDIIFSAFFQIGEFRPNEVPSDGQINQGFNLLNDLIGALSMDSLFIPLDSTILFDAVPGFDKYRFTTELAPIGPPPIPPEPIFIASNRIVKLNYVNTTLVVAGGPGSVIYPIRILSKAEFYGFIKVNQIPGPPSFCFLDIQGQESTVQFYPTPNLAYPIEIKCKVGLDYVTRFTDVKALPPFYFRFLRYALARELLSFYPSSNWPPSSEDEYQTMRKLIQGANSFNLDVRTDQTLALRRRRYPIVSNGFIFI